MNQTQLLEWTKRKLVAAGEDDCEVVPTDEGGVAYTLSGRGGEKYPQSLRCDIGRWEGGEVSAAFMKSMEASFVERVAEQRQYAMGTHPDLMDAEDKNFEFETPNVEANRPGTAGRYLC